MGKDKGKKGNYDKHKFEGLGVDFKCKLIGVTEVSAARGDEICRDAIADLKTLAVKNKKEKKEHKQKLTINITLKGIRLIDETTERIDYAHPIHRISYISHDKDDKRAFSYIVGTKEGYKLFAIRTVKDAELITKTLKELFQEVFARHQAKKEENSEENEESEEVEETKDEAQPNGEVEVADEMFEEDGSKEIEDPALIWGELNDQIQEMQTVGIPHSTSTDMLADPFSSNEDKKNDPFDDNFSAIPTQKTPTQKTPTQKNHFNPFDEIQKNSSSNTEKVDFISLPMPEKIKRSSRSGDLPSVERPAGINHVDEDLYTIPIKNKTSNHIGDLLSVEPDQQIFGINNVDEDLYTMPIPPARNNINDVELMKDDPLEELKKNVEELHKQNIIQQQQKNLMHYGPAYPVQTNPHMTNPYTPPKPNPFVGNVAYSGNIMPPRGSTPPVIPARPAPITNPFTPQSTQNQVVQPNMGGWSMMEPIVPTKEVKKTLVISDDPFAFLDDQAGMKTPSPSIAPSDNQYKANNEIFDLLG